MHVDENRNTEVKYRADLPSGEHIKEAITGMPNICALDDVQMEELRGMLRCHAEAFTKPDGELGLCSKVEHSTKLTDTKPVRMQPCSTNEINKKFIHDQAEDWLAKGIIRASKSAYALPVIVVDQPHHDMTP